MSSNGPVYSVLSNSLLSMCSALLSDIQDERPHNLFDGSSELLPDVAQCEASPLHDQNFEPGIGNLHNSHSIRDNVHVSDNVERLLHKEVIQESTARDAGSHPGNPLINQPESHHSSTSSHVLSKRMKDFERLSAPIASDTKTVSKQDGEESQTDAKFICRECGKKFNYQRFYREHCRIHTGERPHECKYCGKSFRQSNALYIHERVHTGEKRYSCHICAKAFGRRDTLKTHIRTHTGDKPYKCSFCDRSFNQRNSRILHEKVHRNDRKFTCDNCGMKFRQKVGLQNHQRGGGMTRKCSDCKAACPTLCDLKVHRQRVHNEKLYTCGECLTSFSTEKKLEKHNPCNSSNQTLFVCKECARTFDDLQDLGSHECSKICKNSFTCDVCGLVFNSSEQWKTHRLGHSEKEMFQCIQCDMVFKTKRNLFRHMTVHDASGKGSCIPLNPNDGVSRNTEDKSVSDARTEQNRCHEENQLTECYPADVEVNNEVQLQTTTSGNSNIRNDRVFSEALLSNQPPAIDPQIRNTSITSYKIIHVNLEEDMGDMPSSHTPQFTCSDCGKTFGKRQSYTAHLRTHNQECPRKCNLCGIGFKQSSTLNHHVRTHTGEKPYICQMCNISFSQSDGLRTHTLMGVTNCDKQFRQRSGHSVSQEAHSKDGVKEKNIEQNCSPCTQVRPDTCLLSSNTEEGGKPPSRMQMFVCSECGKVFGKRRSYTAHLRTHKPQRPHKCPFCGMSFKQSVTLTHHVRKHTGEKPFSCQVCKKSFSRNDSLQTHVLIHTGAKPYKCKYCETWFNQRSSRYFHEMAHSNTKPYCCEACGIRYSQKSRLLIHQKRAKKVRKCIDCGAQFENLCALHVHQDACHCDGEHVCKKCGREFSNKVRLNKHLPCDPTLPSYYVCRKCKTSFDSRGSLQDHECLHKEETKIKPCPELKVTKLKFTCKDCGKHFNDRGVFKKHCAVHSSDRPYVCESCGKAYKQKGALTSHMRKHTGERPYTCSICKKFYSRSGGLKSHMRVHAKNSKPCDKTFSNKSNKLQGKKAKR